jgi:outer membrane lipoprotein SlyB
MQLKPIAVITVLLFIVTSLSVAGCTNNTTNTATSPLSQAHDATLERYVNITNKLNTATRQKKSWRG